MTFEEYLKEEFGINEPISKNRINYGGYSKPWISKELKKMVGSGVLKKFSDGVYYIPYKMSYGDAGLDPQKVIKRRYISDGESVYGYVAGFNLVNVSGLLTQIPNSLELVSNNEKTRVRDIIIGYSKVRIHRSRTEITKDNVGTLQFLELMNMDLPNPINDMERILLNRFIQTNKVTRESIASYIDLYPKKTATNLISSGAIYDIA